MGNCCGAPSSQGGGGKNRRRKEKPNPFKATYNRAALARAGLVVLWDPTGRNLGAAGHALGGELGRGEFGVTYLCTDAATGARMACKSNSKCKLRTPVDVEDVRREVEIMRHMPPNHNIGSLSATYEDEDAVHIIMELCEGGELFDRIVARGHYTEREPSSRWSSRRLRSSSLEPCRGRTRCRRTSSPGQWRLLGYLVTPGPQRPCLLPEHSPAAGGTAWRRTLPACSVSAAET